MRPPRTRLPRPTERLALGRSGLQVSPFCLGIVSDPALVSAAFEAGINFFFVTADMHWPLYENLRRGLADLCARGLRDQIVVAGCAYVAQPVFLQAPFVEILASVPALERLDVLLAGGAYGGELERRWPHFLEHRRRGFVGARAIGASFHDRKAAGAALAGGELDVAYVRYNPLHSGAGGDLFPALADERATLLYNFKSTFGFVTPARAAAAGLPDDFWVPGVPDYYRYALSRPEIDGCLIAVREHAHLTMLLDALDEGPLAPEEEEHFRLLVESV